MAEQYIIGNNAQFNDSVEILKDLTLYGVVENSTDFAVKIKGDEQLRIASDGVHIGDTISHIGDTDTKIRFPLENSISFETAGSERLRILPDGRVRVAGISTITNLGQTFQILDTDDTDNIGIKATLGFLGYNGGVARTLAAIGASKNSAGSDFAGDLLFFTRRDN